jgi:Cu(I)/Ag(I) efflux system membrane fusion protein
MSPTITLSRRPALLGGAALVLAAGGIGYGVAHLGVAPEQAAAGSNGRTVLYWYDPMIPDQHFDHPGKSPMGMEMVPHYADEGAKAEAPGVTISPDAMQRLGARVVTVERCTLSSAITAPGTIAYDERNVALVQPRASGFVERVYGRAPDDVIRAGAPLADLLVPEWGGAQTEYLAALRSGDAALARAARERLLLLGMAPGLIDSVARSGRAHPVVTIRSPIGGAIKSLGVRKGMTVSEGQTLAEIDGLATVWLDAAVPETIAGTLRVGAPISATVGAFPNETFTGRVSAILPQADTASHTLTVRAELANRGGRLRPGMFATVSLNQGSREALLVPSEALIRTGARTLVMLAEPDGRYRPAEVRTGAESNGRTEVLAGLREGEKIVASGQFLIDSEASLTGVQARPVDAVEARR